MTLDENIKSIVRIDARTKVMMLLVASTLINGSSPLWYELAIFGIAFCMLLNYGNKKIAFQYMVIFLLLYMIMNQQMPVNPATFILLLVCKILRSFLPSMMIGGLFIRTTTIGEIFAVTEKMKIKYKFAIPLAVIIRFFPTLLEEWNHIRMAMKMRGIGISLEYIVVPILNSAIVINDELTAASLTRGLGVSDKRTNLNDVKLNGIDMLIMLFAVAIVIYSWR